MINVIFYTCNQGRTMHFLGVGGIELFFRPLYAKQHKVIEIINKRESLLKYEQ